MAADNDSLIPEPSEEDAAVIEELEASVEEAASTPRYLQGLLFDDDLHLDGTGNIVISEPNRAWLDWCKKVLTTPRYKSREYSKLIGIDTEAAFQAKSRAEAEAILKTEIRGALTADPYKRTANVETIDFDWIAPDSVEVSVNITGFDNIRTNITAQIDGLGE